MQVHKQSTEVEKKKKKRNEPVHHACSNETFGDEMKEEVEDNKNIGLKSSSYFTIKYFLHFPSKSSLHVIKLN